jgi:hypothetical protein
MPPELSPAPRKTPIAAKQFTLDEANRTLPFVSRIVQDIVEEYRHWREHLYRYELIAAGRKSGDPENEEQARLRKVVDESAQRINTFIEELSLVGCVFKGFEEGLVDYRSTLNGRDVFLCWKLGDAAIDQYHETDAGFNNRKPLEPAAAGQAAE